MSLSGFPSLYLLSLSMRVYDQLLIPDISLLLLTLAIKSYTGSSHLNLVKDVFFAQYDEYMQDSTNSLVAYESISSTSFLKEIIFLLYLLYNV